MRYTWRVAEIPDGDTVIPNQSIAVRKISDGSSITTINTDADGFVTLQADGHYEPFYLHLQGVPGGDKFWRSDESHAVGAYSPMEVPVAMRVAGDGVVRGYGSELVVALSGGGPSVTVTDGAAVVTGHPFVQYTASTTLTNTRPVSGTRVDRVIIRLYPVGSATTPGKADLVLLQGSDLIGTSPTLTQSATVYEISLASLSIPSAGTITLTDERAFANETSPVTGETRSAQETTTSAGGEALTNLNTDLVLPRTATYDVEAWVSGVQENGGGWALQAAYGSLGPGTSPNFSSPAQVATDSSGNIYVADTGNSRLVKLSSAGAYSTAITSLTSVTGVCVDSSDNIYVVYTSAVGQYKLRKYNSALTLQWTSSDTIVNVPVHLTTDNTNIYVSHVTSLITKWLCSTGALVTGWGSVGTGNGQFSNLWGIDYNSITGLLYVVDSGNARVQVFNTSGTYQRQWPTSLNGRGIAADSNGWLLVAEPGPDYVVRYTHLGAVVDFFSFTDGDGVVVASGDVVWVSSYTNHTIATWDEAAAGYGGLAVEINSNLGTYITLGNIDGMLQNSHTQTATGPATITVKAYAKATSGTATYKSIVLSAKAIPRS